MSKILILLNTAFDVSNVNNIPVNKSETRITQYINGFKKFFDFDYTKNSHNITFIISDNTIDIKSKISPSILKEIPDNVLFDLKKDNTFGSINKGAGVLTSWKRCQKIIKDNDYILHFEPRLLLLNHNFIIKFLNKPNNIFTIGSNGKHFNTGLFVCTGDILNSFMNQITPEIMCKNNVSLENTLFNFINTSKINFLTEDKMGVVWYDSHTKKSYKM